MLACGDRGEMPTCRFGCAVAYSCYVALWLLTLLEGRGLSVLVAIHLVLLTHISASPGAVMGGTLREA